MKVNCRFEVVKRLNGMKCLNHHLVLASLGLEKFLVLFSFRTAHF